ncbi:putative carbonic anhydrase 1 [Patella vulgata]|uniref:putative carbonic anhydrase 1 n=1 Tax=Patella vulgata TaxID=6465 RepID=UPI0024A7EBCC|nr:putative carbonic anhydrase 1 [Patella vulgata]
MGEVRYSSGRHDQNVEGNGQYYYTTKGSDQDADANTESIDGMLDQQDAQYAQYAQEEPESVGSPLVGDRLLCPDEGKTCFRYNRDSGLRPQCWAGLDSSIIVDGPIDNQFPLNSCCDRSGNFQSPINVHGAKRTEKRQDKLTYNTDDVEGYLENTGVYYKYVVTGEKPVLTGAPSRDGLGYVLDSVHFHIGKKGEKRQTEHLIHGKSFSAEAHVVHHRQDYEDLEEATAHPDGLLVISIMFTHKGEKSRAFNTIFRHFDEVRRYTAADFDNVCALENRRLANLELLGIGDEKEECLRVNSNRQSDNCALLESGPGCGVHVTGIKFNPRSLLPLRVPRYYYYEGGLTSPPCTEALLWLVAEKPKKITESTLDLLYKMETRIRKTELGDHGNLRPLQRRSGRTIRHLQYKRARL